MKFVFGLMFLGLASGFAQYAGPAILSRGEAPAAMSEGAPIMFRPYAEVEGIYDAGLAGIAVTNAGTLTNASGPGIRLAWGVSGSHSWKHTRIGLDYNGDLQHYDGNEHFDATDQALLLGITHQFSRHTLLSLRESAGMFTRNLNLPGLSQSVPFDPIGSYIPSTDFFDNRTFYLTSQADFTLQTSNRLTFDIGGDGFVNRRESTALAGSVGGVARGDVEYRISRRSTIGANYSFSHFDFTRVEGGTDVHAFNGAFSSRLTRTLEFSGYGGVMRVESKLEELVPVDPLIAELLGIAAAPQLVHSISWSPSLAGRLSKTYGKGVFYVSGGHTVTPGNGLFLASFATTAMAGYTFTGLRRWSFSTNAGYNDSHAQGNISGQYGSYTGWLRISRQVSKSVHIIADVNARKYDSSSYGAYNRLVYDVRFGFGFTPGNLPFRIW